MKICHISSMHEVDDDRIFQRACVGLVREGEDISYIVTHDREETIQGVRIIPLKAREGMSRRIFSSWDAYKKALHTDAEIYHLHDPDLLPIMLLLKWKGKKVVYDIHENYAVRFRNRRIPTFLQGTFIKLWRAYERFIIGRIDGIVVVTESICSFFKDKAKNHVVVSNMTDIELLKDISLIPIEDREQVIYVSGNNTPDRNVKEMVEAMPKVLKEFPNAKMLIAGTYTNGYKELLAETIVTHHLSNAVSLEGMLPWKENFLRTRNAYIGCVFWKKNENYSVTIPNRIFEYMFCQVAVLSDDTVELRKVIDGAKSGYYCDSTNSNSIADAIIYLLKHPKEVAEMALNGRKAVLEKYNFNVQLKDLIVFYKKILST